MPVMTNLQLLLWRRPSRCTIAPTEHQLSLYPIRFDGWSCAIVPKVCLIVIDFRTFLSLTFPSSRALSFTTTSLWTEPCRSVFFLFPMWNVSPDLGFIILSFIFCLFSSVNEIVRWQFSADVSRRKNKSLEPDSSSKGLTVVGVSTNTKERLQRQRTPWRTKNELYGER